MSRKEAKECVYWPKLIQETNALNDPQTADRLMHEAIELTKFLSSLASKSA
jgi:four helix bundle protein